MFNVLRAVQLSWAHVGRCTLCSMFTGAMMFNVHLCNDVQCSPVPCCSIFICAIMFNVNLCNDVQYLFVQLCSMFTCAMMFNVHLCNDVQYLSVQLCSMFTCAMMFNIYLVQFMFNVHLCNDVQYFIMYNLCSMFTCAMMFNIYPVQFMFNVHLCNDVQYLSCTIFVQCSPVQWCSSFISCSLFPSYFFAGLLRNVTWNRYQPNCQPATHLERRWLHTSATHLERRYLASVTHYNFPWCQIFFVELRSIPCVLSDALWRQNQTFQGDERNYLVQCNFEEIFKCWWHSDNQINRNLDCLNLIFKLADILYSTILLYYL